MNIKPSQLQALFVLVFLIGILNFTIQFYFPILYVQLGFNPFQIGTVTALGLLSVFLFSTPIGILCDRWDIRKILLFSLLLIFIFAIGMFYTKEFALICILVILFRVALNITKLAPDNLIMKLNSSEKSSLFGNYQFFVSLGLAIGSLLGGLILSNGNFGSIFLFIGFSAAVLAFLIPLIPKVKIHQTKLHQYKKDVINKNFFILAILMFLYAFHFGAEHISYSLFLKYELNLSFGEVGKYLFISLTVMAFGALWMGKILNKSNVLTLYPALIFLSGLSHILMSTHNYWFSLLFRCTHEIGDIGALISLFLILKVLSKDIRIGGNYGVINTVSILGTIIGAYLFSYIGFQFSHGLSLIISGALSIIASLIFFLFFQKKLS